MEILAIIGNLPQVLNYVNDHLDMFGCSMRAQMQIDIAVEEVFVNIAHYAYHPGKGIAEIRISYLEESSTVVLSFIDSGRKFNPLAKMDPDITLSVEDRQIGGLGIFMTKKIMDKCTYEYLDGKNILTLEKILK